MIDVVNHRPILIFQRNIYENLGWFTKEQLDLANATGLIGIYRGIECYLPSYLKANAKNSRPRRT